MLLQVIIQVLLTQGIFGAVQLDGNKNFGSLLRQKRASNYDLVDNHTVCLKKSDQVTESGVTEADKTMIVNLHNNLRAKVKPTASNMLKMKWNNEIANIAQKWAENCDFHHDSRDARNIPGRYAVGQNIATDEVSFEAAINLWLGEKEYFTYGSMETILLTIAHNRQINWWESNLVGCGYAKCGTTNYHVCNYAPAGNERGKTNKPYKLGEPCADCPNNCDPNGKLCVCDNTCWHGTKMSVSECKCDCINQLAFITNSCKLDCNVANDDSFCDVIGDDCDSIFMYCPIKCKMCPAADYRNVEKEEPNCDGI
ncbi:hypothetical protein LOTGIDRAFT_232000 [Lottia gigantea]|uniref:SCP domain-containing protein n=1 Tax=Lottia gigantea TaxID=225164 RepID=V4AEH1_LOTGI|nr:hypothetical protein LOTGIDRAFT_232000 [Lottia gigantea]ESO95282.1 hypothetical protein LOTGIDRAFT_232000 [Lottia gigantea]